MTTLRPLDFNPEHLPWLDKYYLAITEYVRTLSDADLPEYDLRLKLIQWVQNGYVRFPQLIQEDLIDAYLSDVNEFLCERNSGVRLTIEGHGVRPAREFPAEAWAQHHLRIMDFHNVSTAGKALVLHPELTLFLGHIFRQPPVAMQSLTFLYSTEQSAHQDFPYVTAQVPSHLAAVWIALEDVSPEAGPLFYFRGSHAIPKFDWGNGLFLTPDSSETPDAFAAYLEDTVATTDESREVFCPKKGDVFVWHASLVHGGSPVIDPTLTRRSLVVHYSSQQGYYRDRRAPDTLPTVYDMNGGMLFADPINPDEEDRYNRWPLPPSVRILPHRELRA